MKKEKLLYSSVLVAILGNSNAYAGDLVSGVNSLTQYGTKLGLAVGVLAMIVAGILYGVGLHMHGNERVKGAILCAICVGAGGTFFSILSRYFS